MSLAPHVVWLDTNVIIRYITADHPTMTPETAQLMERVDPRRSQSQARFDRHRGVLLAVSITNLLLPS